MFKTLRDAWSIPEIRKKLLYTLLMLLIFRLGSAVVVPFLDTSTVSTWMASNATGGNFLEYLDIITGGALSQATVFSLSITPYINASIIMQLLTYALPPLERMRDEGEEGQKKLNKITAAVSLALSVFMSFAYYLTLKNQMNAVVDGGSKAANVFIAFVIILSFIAGTSIVVWMGNQINDKGIGNGISMLLFAGILARFPVMAGTLGELTKNEPQRYFFESLGHPGTVHRNDRFHCIHERIRTPDPDPVCKACCRQKTVWRPVYPHSGKGLHERRYADHLRHVLYVSAQHHQPVQAGIHRPHRLLAEVL